MRFTVGLKRQGKAEHIVLDAEDALIAALKVKAEKPDAAPGAEIMRGLRSA